MPPKLIAAIFFLVTVSINIFAANLLDTRAEMIFLQQQLVILKEAAVIAAASIDGREHDLVLEAVRQGGRSSEHEAKMEFRLRKFLESSLIYNAVTIAEIHGSAHYVLDARDLGEAETPLSVYSEYHGDKELEMALKKRKPSVTAEPRMIRGAMAYTAYAPVESSTLLVVALDMEESSVSSAYSPMRKAIAYASFIMVGMASAVSLMLYWSLSLMKRLGEKREVSRNENHQ